MVLGFLGTLIALERAVAHRRSWGFVAPIAAAGSTLWLLVGGRPVGAAVLSTIAAATVLAMVIPPIRAHRETHLAVMALGAAAWLAAAGLWAAGTGPVRLMPFLATFLVLTIAGERLELSRLRRPSTRVVGHLLTAIAVFMIGVIASRFAWGPGLIVAGIGLVAMTAWLARHDLAWVTVRRAGLPRYAATCMLAGYVWLAIGGLLWVALGLGVGGPLIYDAATHAVFLGFVISMVMGHAPIILPAVLRIQLPYRPVAWGPLVLLHLTLAVRVGADLAGSTWGRGLGAYANVAALLTFVLTTVLTVLHARSASTTRAAT